MEEKIEFPKSAKEFYDQLVARNKLNDIKITKKAVEKLYEFLLEIKEERNYLDIYGSVSWWNSKDNLDRKGASQICGTCPNCGNHLSWTGGKCLSRTMSIYQEGVYCLNCGKIYGKESTATPYIEKERPVFHRTNLKS